MPSPESDPCNPSPCGPNAQCNAGICTCLPNYQGDPYTSCRPECVLNNDCPLNRACVRNKCVDPCPGTCGRNAICNVLNHIPMCSCPVGMAGNAFIFCERIEGMINKKKIVFTEKIENKKKITLFLNLEQVQVNLCNPSPCGPNSQCRAINAQAVCSCVPGFLGNPPNCRPECVVSSDCPRNQACNNQKCIDPCSGTCGWKALCQVVNHNPVCSCPSGFTGDPFFRCEFISKNHYLSFCFRKNQ